MLDKICTDLETSKKLKELGFEDAFEGEDAFYYYERIDGTSGDAFYYFERISDDRLIPAYTLEQIIDELPQIKDYCLSLNIMTVLDELQKTIGYYDEKALLIGENNGIKKPADNWATTAAKLWIKLKQDKIKYFRKNGKNYFIKE